MKGPSAYDIGKVYSCPKNSAYFLLSVRYNWRYLATSSMKKRERTLMSFLKQFCSFLICDKMVLGTWTRQKLEFRWRYPSYVTCIAWCRSGRYGIQTPRISVIYSQLRYSSRRFDLAYKSSFYFLCEPKYLIYRLVLFISNPDIAVGFCPDTD